MSERIHLTPRQLQLLAPQVQRVQYLRQQAVNVQEALDQANAQLVRECEMVYPQWTKDCRFIASEGVIELPKATPVATLDGGEVPENAGKYLLEGGTMGETPDSNAP